MITDIQANATRKKAILVFALVGAVIVVAVLALRGGGGDAKKGASGGDTIGSTQSGATSSAMGDRANAGTTATSPSSNDPSANHAGAGADVAAHPSAGASGVMSGTPVDMTQLLLEAKVVHQARTALAAGDPRGALKELEFYDKIPNASSLKQEATILRIQALAQVGRKTDARALAYSTRDDPSFKTYQDRVEAALAGDAGSP